jgi:hypothetical protein
MTLKGIEQAEVTCLVDNSVDVLLPNSKIAHRPLWMKNGLHTHLWQNMAFVQL